MYYYLSKRGMKKCLRALFPNIKEDDEYQIDLIDEDKHLYEIKSNDIIKKVYLFNTLEPFFKMRKKTFVKFLNEKNIEDNVMEDNDIKKVNNYLKEKDLYDDLFDYFFPIKDIDIILTTDSDGYLLNVLDYKQIIKQKKLSNKVLQIGGFKIRTYDYSDMFASFRITKL